MRSRDYEEKNREHNAIKGHLGGRCDSEGLAGYSMGQGRYRKWKTGSDAVITGLDSRNYLLPP